MKGVLFTSRHFVTVALPCLLIILVRTSYFSTGIALKRVGKSNDRGNRGFPRSHNGKQDVLLHQDRSSAEEKKVLAFYNPQFHEVEVNNKALGKGFMDFTNVAKVQNNYHGYPIIRPAESDGFYDSMDPLKRFVEGKLSKTYGIYGFVMMHHWFSDHAVMDETLQAMLKDGQPDTKLCLMWANEAWTGRWDGLSDPNVIFNQTYNSQDWLAHWKWMLHFLQHKNYIKVDGKPMLVVYRPHKIPELPKLLATWHSFAEESGFAGLHIVQMNGIKFTPDAHALAKDVDAAVEYYPKYYTSVKQWPLHQTLITPKTAPIQYYGAHCSWDNTPRHISDGKSHQTLVHPFVYTYMLRQNLARTSPGGFVFVNAWNEWGEGAAIEPSVQWGRRWLEATQEAVTEERLGKVLWALCV